MSESDRRRETLRTHMILSAVTATAAFAAVIALSLFVPVISHFEHNTLNADALAGLADHVLYLHTGFWPVVCVALVATVVSAMLLFQRMTGPLVRMVRVLQAVEQGQVPDPLVIRTADYLQEEARALNAMTASLGARWAALAESEAALREGLEELAAYQSELPESLRPRLDALLKSGEELRSQIEPLS